MRLGNRYPALATCGLWLVLGAVGHVLAADGELYRNDFEKAELGKTPADMLVLAGEFVVKKEAGNAFLEVPGAPLDSFGVLVGPEDGSGNRVAARIYGTKTGKRFPEFGVGLGGASGYRLWLMPAVNELQLVKDDQVKASVPYAWTSGTWTHFRLRLHQAGEGKWRLEGKAWEQGKPEPAQWMITLKATEEAPAGRASLWGIPYTETVIRFDDVAVGKE